MYSINNNRFPEIETASGRIPHYSERKGVYVWGKNDKEQTFTEVEQRLKHYSETVRLPDDSTISMNREQLMKHFEDIRRKALKQRIS
jgi:hypothetical protein